MHTEVQAALALNLVEGMTPARLRNLYHMAGSFCLLAEQGLAALAQKLPPAIEQVVQHYGQHRQHYLAQAAELLEHYCQQGIRLHCLADDSYPALLREIHRPPPLLSVRGNSDLLALPQVAIVGSRKASRGGLQHAEDFACALAGCGFVVTSGLALGIDGAAHRGALKAGKTVAVLGCGVDVIYPRQNRALYEQILAADGALVSEFPPGTKVRAEYFPQRNRIISGLSLGVLVVEAALQSGSLITARLAMEQGREVFAVPGSIHNVQARGCHQLIREGAVLVESVEDIVNQLGGMLAFKAAELPSEAKVEPALSTLEQAVLDAMGFEPLDLDTLVSETNLAVSELTGALVNLELLGWIESAAGSYIRLRP